MKIDVNVIHRTLSTLENLVMGEFLANAIAVQLYKALNLARHLGVSTPEHFHCLATIRDMLLSRTGDTINAELIQDRAGNIAQVLQDMVE